MAHSESFFGHDTEGYLRIGERSLETMWTMVCEPQACTVAKRMHWSAFETLGEQRVVAG